MYCPKCNKEINDGTVFCNNCGSRLIENPSFSTNQNSNTNSVVDIQSLTKAYIGDKYESIRTKDFSLCYFFFDVYYAIYRKMYLMGIALLALYSTLLYIDPKLCIIVMGIVNIIISIRFNHIYIKHVDRVVEKIRRDNSESRVDLLRICRNEGGTNSVFVLLAFLIVGFLSYSKTKDQIDNFLPNGSTVKEVNYQQLSIEKPSDFESTTDSDGNILFNYDKSKNSCNYTIQVIDSSNTSRNYLNRKAIYTSRDIKNPIETININNKDWDLLKVNTSSNALIYDYAIVYNHYLYNITYKIYKDNGICTNLKDELIDSIKLKK